MKLKTIKIAMVSPSHNAYSETFIQDQKNGLKGNVFYYYGGELPTHLEDHGKLLTHSISLINKIKRKLNLSSFSEKEVAFIHSLKREKIQVVFAQYGTTAHRIVKICKHLKIPLITHFHGYDASMYHVIENCKNYKEVFEYSSSIISVSTVMSERLISLGCTANKVRYNPYAPNPSFLEINPQFSEVTFIGLGRFVDKKAPYYTILAFKQVLKEYPNATLIIGGIGPLYNSCLNLVNYLKIKENVLLPGVLTREQFSNYLTTSLAFVQHSITAISGDQEGTPVAVLEASAAGLPVISTFHAGIPDVIIDGKTGFLVKEHDVNEMAAKMLVLLGDIEKAKSMGNEGKSIIRNQFSKTQQIGHLNKIISEAIEASTL